MSYKVMKELLEEEFSLSPEEMSSRHPSLYANGAVFIRYEECGTLTLSYPVRAEQRNGNRTLQGGMIASFIDDNFGIFSHLASGRNPMPSVNMALNFHRAVTEDIDRIFVTSRVIKTGKNILSLEAVVRDSQDNIIATCQSNMLNANHVKIDY